MNVNWARTKVNVPKHFCKRNALSLFIVLVTWILWTVSRADDWISFSPKFVYLIRALKEHKWVPDIDFTETCLSSFYPLCSYKYIRSFAVLRDSIKNNLVNNKNIFSPPFLLLLLWNMQTCRLCMNKDKWLSLDHQRLSRALWHYKYLNVILFSPTILEGHCIVL